MQALNYTEIIKLAWTEFDDRHEIRAIYDVSAHVSTNQVYKISFFNREPVFAKLSDYGKFDDFREDHVIINNLANNIESPYENFLAKALIKRNELYIYRYHQSGHSAWVIFYNPIKLMHKLPRRLEEKQIKKMGRELARFHIACTNVSNQLPRSSKNLITDINRLTRIIKCNNSTIKPEHCDLIKRHCDIFLYNSDKLNYITDLETIPVFVDWNIGNFSVTAEGKFFSRWDYDWFRDANRVMDFYFFSRVVSNVGDKTVFSYLVDTLMEERFILFLKEYHRIFPLTEAEVRFIGEAYRFFILNYVIKDGPYFFRQSYIEKLQKEAFEIYLPAIEKNFNAEKLLTHLKI
jgi:hypothetical protein